MNQISCNSCQYYKQHYVLDQRMILRVHCGHGTFSRIKTKKPDSKTCEHYVHTAPDEDAFATKEYLSKKLLEYILKLELLPTIHDAHGETAKKDHPVKSSSLGSP